MAAFCEFYHMTPNEFWDMWIDDYQALGRRMARRAEEQKNT